MFGTIRRHQKWLWIVISAVTIISFVAFFSPQQRKQRGWTGPKDTIGSINGRSLSRAEYAHAYREAQLSYLFRFGEWPGDDRTGREGSLIEREARQRLVLLDKLQQLDIQVSDAAVAQWIRNTFQDPETKTFREEAYRRFIQSLPMRGLSQGEFEQFARHEAGIQHLAALAGSAGKIITPQEAEAQFRRENEELEAAAIFIPSSNFLAHVTVEPAALEDYYNKQSAAYRIPEKLQVAFVKFAASNYVASVDQELARNTNLNRIIDSTYQQRGTNAFVDASGAPLAADAAKQKIRDEIRNAMALEHAQSNAVQFLNQLGEQEKNVTLENFAAAKGFISEVSEPFTQFQTPANMKVPPSFGQSATQLSADEPILEQPVRGEDGVYVVAFKQRIPSEVPPLDTIRERVTRDYQNSKAQEMARAAGNELHNAITNGLAQGKTFEAVAAEKNFSPVLLSPFSRKASTLPGLPNSSDAPRLVGTAFALSPGQVSNFVPTASGGFLVFVKGTVPVSPERVKAELPEYTRSLRQSRQFEAFSEWFQKEMEASHLSFLSDQKRASAQ